MPDMAGVFQHSHDIRGGWTRGTGWRFTGGRDGPGLTAAARGLRSRPAPDGVMTRHRLSRMIVLALVSPARQGGPRPGNTGDRPLPAILGAAPDLGPDDLKERVFEYLANHPDGTPMVELEHYFSVSRFQMARTVRRLMDENKVEKRGRLYSAI